MGLKRGAIGNTLEEPREHIGNLNGTKEKQKNILSSRPPSPTPQNLKEKKIKAL
jgi:hypothetical protein